jgi:MFS family permease
VTGGLYLLQQSCSCFLSSIGKFNHVPKRGISNNDTSVNIANARIEGMLTDLHMVKHDYNNALFIVFIPFILCETPSNMILKRITPRIWLSFLLFGCGLMAICQGVTKSFTGLVVCRFILGIFEAGISPGSILLITMYYRREELPRRICWWYMSGTIAGAFGGLLAYALANM